MVRLLCALAVVLSCAGCTSATPKTETQTRVERVTATATRTVTAAGADTAAVKRERLSRIEFLKDDLGAFSAQLPTSQIKALAIQLNHDAILALALPPPDKLQAAFYSRALTDLASLTVAVEAGDLNQIDSLLKDATQIITNSWKPATW